MQALINDALAVIMASLVVAGIVVALIVFRPWKRRQRHRRRHSRQPKIDLFSDAHGEPAAKRDA